MDTEKRQGLVKRHEQVDARVWNQFFGAWWPLAPWSEMSVAYRADLGVDQGTVVVPYSHQCASVFRQVRDGVPAPISIEVNGVFISGQITTAQAERAEETQAWHLTIQTDAKHAHSMMARPLVQSAADNAETQLRGELGVVARQLIGLASSRTGLPAYVCVDAPGDPVDLVARTEDTVADVLSHAISGSDLFVDVRMLLPGQDLPGENLIERFAGSVERQWENAALDAGLWPHAETDERLIDVVEGPNGVIPPFSWHGVASVNHVGELLEEPAEGYVWLPFATQAPYIGSEYYEPDRPMLDGSRVITGADLDSHAEKFPGWASFVTEWKPGAVFSELQESGRLHEAAKVGLLRLPDGTKLPASWAELGPLLHDYLGWEDRNYTTPGVFAWRDGASWVISNAADMVEEKAKRAANLAQKQTPGVLFHFYPERDRRGIIFSSVPGGGLKAWSATYTAPDAAMLIAAAQLDEWTMQQMGLGTLPEQAVTGEQSATPVDASTMKNIPATVDQIDVDVQPQARLEGSDVAYHAAGGRVDIGKAGPFFYREKYLNLGNSGTINPVQQMAQEWSRAQGSTTVQLTPSGRGGAVFGEDIVGDDGRRIPGWKHGDRVSFVDGDTRISEVIVGWTLTANAGEPLEVSPILGREDNGVLAQLGERIRGAERTSKKTALSPPRRIPAKEIEDRAEDVFVREGSAWSEKVRESIEEGRQHVIDAGGHAADARANAETAFSEAERAVGLVADASLIIDQAQEKLDTIPAIIESGRRWAQMSAAQSASSQVFASQALVHADKADEHAQSALRLVDDALVLVDAADAALDLIEAELAKIPGLIAQGEQHVADAAGHAQDARDNAQSAQGLVTTATNLVADANLILDEANIEMGKIPGIIAEGEQHVIDAGNYAQAAFGHADDARGLVADAGLILDAANVELAKIPGLIAEGEQHVADAGNHATDARENAASAQGLVTIATDLVADAGLILDEANIEMGKIPGIIAAGEQHVTAALGHANAASVSASAAVDAVGQVNLLVDEADAILVDARALHAMIQPMIDQGAQHVTNAKNHADRADQAVTDAGAAKTAAETALTNATNLLADIDGEGTDFPTAVTQVLGAHNDVLTKHGEVLDAHGEAITAANNSARDAGAAAQSALDSVTAVTQVQTLHGEVLTKHGQAIRAAGSASAMASMSAMQATETARSAAQSAQSALDGVETLATVQVLHTEVLTKHGEAIVATAGAASFAAAAAVDATETAESAALAAEDALDAAEALATVQALHTDTLTKHGEAITAATNAASDATNAASSATKASADALKAAGSLTTVQGLHGEVLTKHGEAIVATAGAASFAAAAAVDATETAESAAGAAQSALNGVATLGLIQTEMIEVDRLQNRAIRAAASAAAQASMAAMQAAETGRLAAQAAGEAGKAAASAGKAAQDALDATGTLAAVQADSLEVQRLHGEAIRAVAAAASFAAAAAVDATETAESAVGAADAALDAIEAMNGALLRQEQASGAALESALSAQDASAQALLAQQIGWRKFVHPGTHGLTVQDDRVGVTILPNGLSGQISYGDNAFWAGELFGKVYYTNNTVEPIYSKVPFSSTLNFGGGNTPVKVVEVDYRDSQRKGMRSVDGISTGWQVPANNAWHQYKTGRPWTVTVPHATDFSAVFSVGWDAAGYLGSYSIQARVNGVARKTVRNEGFGPQFFWLGSGYRTQLLSISGADSLKLQAGDTVSFWVNRERNGNTVAPEERKIRNFQLSVTWSEPE